MQQLMTITDSGDKTNFNDVARVFRDQHSQMTSAPDHRGGTLEKGKEYGSRLWFSTKKTSKAKEHTLQHALRKCGETATRSKAPRTNGTSTITPSARMAWPTRPTLSSISGIGTAIQDTQPWLIPPATTEIALAHLSDNLESTQAP